MSTSDGPDERRSTRWRRVVLTIGVLVGAGVFWGSLSPGRGGTDRCAEPVDDDRRARGRIRPGSNDRRRDARFRRRSPRRAQRAPPWCRLVASAALGPSDDRLGDRALRAGRLRSCVAADSGVRRRISAPRPVLLSFAMEPAVNYIHARWNWRRGLATGLLLGIVFLGMLLIVSVAAGRSRGPATSHLMQRHRHWRNVTPRIHPVGMMPLEIPP